MTKVIKIQTGYYQRGTFYKEYRKVPKITISGDWLAEAGFTPAKKIQVKCVNNQLVITPLQ